MIGRWGTATLKSLKPEGWAGLLEGSKLIAKINCCSKVWTILMEVHLAEVGFRKKNQGTSTIIPMTVQIIIGLLIREAKLSKMLGLKWNQTLFCELAPAQLIMSPLNQKLCNLVKIVRWIWVRNNCKVIKIIHSYPKLKCNYKLNKVQNQELKASKLVKIKITSIKFTMLLNLKLINLEINWVVGFNK